MRLNRNLFWLIVLIFLLSVSVSRLEAQDLTVKAEIDRATCNLGDRLTYTLTLEGKSSLPDPETPDFRGFDVVMGPSTSTQIQMINGRISRTLSHTYIIRSKQPGTLTIPSVKVKDKRRTYSSNPVEIEVLPAGKSPISSKPDKLTTRGDAKRALPDVFLVATSDQDTLFLRDMATISYELYFKINVSNYGFPDLPSVRGFWQEEFDLPRRPQLRDVQVRGLAYKVATIRKVGLFPTRTGTLTIEPLTADVTVELPRSRRRGNSIFDDPFFSFNQSEVRSVTTEPLELTVLQFPSIGKPVNFQGDVGDFRLNVNYDSREITQHDALNVKVTISGSGYLKSIKAPELVLPDGFEQFDPTVTEQITTSGHKMRGKLEFNYLIIPRRSGIFSLMPVSFSYFNPALRTYEQVSAGGGSINVIPATNEDLYAGSANLPERIAILGSDIRFIKELATPLSPKKLEAYQSRWFYLSMALSPLLFLLLFGADLIITHRMADPNLVRLRRAPEKMRKDLTEASKLVKQDQFIEAFTIASHGLAEMVGATIREPAAGLTLPVVEKKLMEKDLAEESIGEIKNLLSKADQIRFSGLKITLEEANGIITQYSNILSVLEKVR